MEVTVDFLPYKEVTVGKKRKKGKTWRNEVDTKTVKIATSEFISQFQYCKGISLYCKGFFLHNFLRGITYQKLIFYGRIPLKPQNKTEEKTPHGHVAKTKHR